MEERKPKVDLLPGIIITAPFIFIERLDQTLKALDEVFREFDSRLLYGRVEELIALKREISSDESSSRVMSPSYPGQTPEDYCLECLTRHYLKALGLLEEAERFSISKGEITPEGRERIELALKEIVTAEEDLGTRIRDPELARMIDEIKAKQREFRKWLWSEKLLTTQKDLSKLREAILKMKEIVDLTRKASEYYDIKYGKCGYCEMLAEEVSSKFNVDKLEVLESIYGLSSDDKERARKSAEKLKNLGVLEYLMKRVEEILTEIKSGEGL
ncbi:MAG: hypothetical protein QW632_04410 [Ignisphaera sp.]